MSSQSLGKPLPPCGGVRGVQGRCRYRVSEYSAFFLDGQPLTLTIIRINNYYLTSKPHRQVDSFSCNPDILYSWVTFLQGETCIIFPRSASEAQVETLLTYSVVNHSQPDTYRTVQSLPDHDV
ncbi:hypothetical protein E2C01_060559 [Portunus trituberculatus]|uniref:Uncharacterized protein n=1 Tax=Portunus trituberculatus TaxID=210409 RepID=A0A5B7H5T9_PORTR|nr:hypothetical protein [Portunus trituberculatus]